MGDVPTNVGWHWWRDTGGIHRWRPLKVFLSKGELCVQYPAGSFGGVSLADLAQMGGEWGERIPDNDTLKAMRTTIKRANPWAKRLGEYFCSCCGTRDDHAADCPWLLAQEKEG